MARVPGRQKKRIREMKYRRKLKKRYSAFHCILPPAIPVDMNNKWADEDEEGFVRYRRSYNPGRAKYLRKLSNRIVRKRKDVPSRGGYRKCFDYWWTLW